MENRKGLLGKMRKGIIYYTDNVPRERFLVFFRNHLKRVCGDIPIVWVSQKPIDEEPNIVMAGIGRHHSSICKQIMAGLKALDVDVIFFAEHDVIYHPSHFEFDPPQKDVFYYNANRYYLRARDGQASHKIDTCALSHIVVYKDICLKWYTKRIRLYERGVKTTARSEPAKGGIRRLGRWKKDIFHSKWPNVDIRHRNNYTAGNRFKENNRRYILTDGIPFWGHTKGRYKEFIECLTK